jgi:hypothetical protein
MMVFFGYPTDFLEVLFNRRLIKLLSIPLDDGDGILRAVAETGAETIAEIISREPGLAVDNSDGPFGAGRHAHSAAVAFFFVNLDNFSDHDRYSLWVVFGG